MNGSGSRAVVNSRRNRNGIFRRHVLDLLDRAVERHEREQHHQPFQHAHAHAGQVIVQLLEQHDPQAVQGRAFTPHSALPRESGSSGYRSLRGSAPRPTAAAGVPPAATTAAAASGRTSRSASRRSRFGPTLSTCCTPGTLASRSASPCPSASTSTLNPPPSTCRPSSAHGTDEGDVAVIEQGDAIADALHPIEQVRRQQHRHAALLEIADDTRAAPAVACGSSPEVGSSRIAISASFIRISASPSRWRMPREKVPDPVVDDVGEPDMGERRLDLLLALGRFEADQPRGVAQIVGGREIVVEADLVGQIADPALHRQRLAHRIMPEHPRLAGGNVGQAEQHQDGGGLARRRSDRAGRKSRRARP